jgi:GH15 family glucan-1,4-alpha-glucosidase
LSADGIRVHGVLPLRQYAVLGDGRSVALVGADGSIDWWCVPNLDSMPLFDRLLDGENGGRFSLTPVENFTVERRYRPDSNVLEQIFTTKSGRARVTDSLNSGISGRLPWSELGRRVEGLEGAVAFHVEALAGRRLDGATSWREASPHGDVLHVDGIIAAIRSTGGLERLAADDRGIVARLVTNMGSRDTVAMLATADEPLILPPLGDVDARIDRSDGAWREWSTNLGYDGPYGADVRRSALALKLLLFSPTGAIAAAATTSLPERLGGDKNYDYRYAWVRDVAYTIKAFLRVGATEEAAAAFAWLIATIRRHDGLLRTMYRLDGALAPEEQALDLPGYAGSVPVKAGNRARDQLQLGVFGDVLETAALFVAQGHVLDLVTRRLLADVADSCADLWRKRDSGIWELEQLEHYTMSKIGCWTALDRAVTLASQGQIDTSHVQRWERERNRIRDWIDAHCWSEAKQSYTLHAGTERLDASLLLATRFGFERRERLAATREAVRRELCRGPHVYRYSGMENEEGTFIACGFWLVEAFALLGDVPSAVRQMDAMLAACNGDLGLLSEQFDPKTGDMLGNMPQALSHLALIHAASSIGEGRHKANSA